jgi:tricorn protease
LLILNIAGEHLTVINRSSMILSLSILALFGFCTGAKADEQVRLARHPSLSPYGKDLLFSWRGDIWKVSSHGGTAQRLTHNPGEDVLPRFSPDGREIAFTSNRTGANQIHRMSNTGSRPTQLTFHSEGSILEGWAPDGESLLVSASRDHFWRHSQRFFRIPNKARAGEKLLFNAYGRWARLSPDGSKVLFTREGTRWWRKGYVGSQSAQIWIYNLKSGRFDKIMEEPGACRYPLWKASGKGFYYVSQATGSFNLYSRDFGGKSIQLTSFSDDSVLTPTLSKDGSTLVFRHLFDLYVMNPEAKNPSARRLKIRCSGDYEPPKTVNRTLTKATDFSLSPDGLNMAFISGGDVWVMDTELKEPVQVTKTAEEEREPLFSPDGKSLLFVSDFMDQSDIWQAKPADSKKFWWQNERFEMSSLTNDAAVESRMSWSPDGTRLAFVRGRGDLFTVDREGKQIHCVLRSWNAPRYSWSPDGAWMAYSVEDNDFNQDIWLIKTSGQSKPFNLSRHPDSDSGPLWSPDGKMIAFTGRRSEQEVDVYYVMLQRKESEFSARDRTLKKALDKMKKGGKKASLTKKAGKSAKNSKKSPKSAVKSSKVPVKIDFQNIHERIRRISIPNSRESSLMWSPDSKLLAFRAVVGGKAGLYTVSPATSARPVFMTALSGSRATWLKNNKIAWLVGGIPSTLDGRSKAPAAYPFRAYQTLDLAKRHRAAFDLCWRAMRDNYYDGQFNNRNWSAIRRKYRDVATSPNQKDLETVVSLMLGELNGSHLGFRALGNILKPRQVPQWREATAHFGLRFDFNHKGAGLLVKDVIPGGPSSLQKSQIKDGEIVLSVDGKNLDSDLDLSAVLTGRLNRDYRLRVQSGKNERTVILRPTTYRAVRSLLYTKWIKDNRAAVDKLSKNKLGYVHIKGMNWPSFLKFEEELYSAGAGKEGLIIDVRENGGGFTTDHLLTILTQPDHSITVPRGGGRGYPQGRRVYATWNKPIIVLCNQNSFSNAEIFSHAIKTLKRGRVVGVQTAGGVISTGGRGIMDLGFLRLPFRGWYLLNNGEDMELNGALPHSVVWPSPGDWPAGRDEQLSKSVKMLLDDVKSWKKKRRPKLRNASERR